MCSFLVPDPALDKTDVVSTKPVGVCVLTVVVMSCFSLSQSWKLKGTVVFLTAAGWFRPQMSRSDPPDRHLNVSFSGENSQIWNISSTSYESELLVCVITVSVVLNAVSSQWKSHTRHFWKQLWQRAQDVAGLTGPEPGPRPITGSPPGHQLVHWEHASRTSCPDTGET